MGAAVTPPALMQKFVDRGVPDDLLNEGSSLRSARLAPARP